MFRNLRIARSSAFLLILVCGLAVAGCGGPVAAQVQGGVADATAAKASLLGPQQHAVASSDGRDPYTSARDVGTGEFARDVGTGELFFAAAVAPLGLEQHAVVSSEGRDPYASARDIGTGEFIADIATGESLR